MKTCPKCLRSLDEECFAKKREGKQARCRDCHSEYTRDHYKRNKQMYKDKAARWNRDRIDNNRLWINMLFLAGCADCGTLDPRVLEFDHTGNKNFAISDRLYKPIQELMLEIEKCDIVCANCHRIRTSERYGDWRSNMALPSDKES